MMGVISDTRLGRAFGNLWPIGEVVPKMTAKSEVVGITAWHRILRIFWGFSRNMAPGPKHLSADDAPTSHSQAVAGAVCERQYFLPNLEEREHGIAPSQGRLGWDIGRTCTDRGRQEEWYKDLWHSQWQHLWRWLLYRAVTTACRSQKQWMRPFSSRLTWNAELTSLPCRGRVDRPVCNAPFVTRGA